MAVSPGYSRASRTPRALTDDIFDALREAVIVVDARSPHLPLILANDAARHSFLGDVPAVSLVDSSLYSLLGEGTDSAIAAALSMPRGKREIIRRPLNWRFLRGEYPLSTELQVLDSGRGQPLVMFSFVDPTAEPFADLAARSAVEQMPLDLLILDNELRVTYANGGAGRAAGTNPEELVGLSALVVAPTSAVPRERLTAALGGEVFRDDAVAVASPGSPTRWFDVTVQPMASPAQVVGLVVLSMEVTERRRQRRAAGNDKRLVTLTANATDIIAVADGAGWLQYVSGGVANAMGYQAEERVSRSVFELVHSEDVEALKCKFDQLVAGVIAGFSRQVRMRHKDGTYRWLEWTCNSALDNPIIHGVVINARDITERKAAELRLEQREEVFKLAADAVNGIIFEWDLTQGLVHRSRGVHDLLGLEPKELEAVGAWTARIHPLDYVSYAENTAAALGSGRGWTASYRIRNAHGRYRSILERALIQRGADGKPLKAIGCVVDVSEIKRLTDLLEEAQRVSQIGSWEYTYATRELEWTEEMYRIYETAPSDFKVTWASMMARCPAESRQRVNEEIEAAESAGRAIDVELEILTMKGRRIWVRVAGHIERLDGRPFRAFGSVQNIHAQKLAQIALENSTEWLKLSMNMADMHAWRWDRASDTLEFAIVEGKLEDLPRVFPGLRKLMSRLHPKDRLAVRRAVDLAFERHTEVQREFRLKSHDGCYRVYSAVARPVFDASNQPSGLVGVTQDVTARHESQARLHRSEELLRTTTANTADTLILVDTELRICFINRAMAGLGVDALVGRDVSVLLPTTARASVTSRLLRVLATGDSATFEYAAKDGGVTNYFECRAVPVREDGIGTGISITVRDVTERKRLEQEILDVSTRERTSIGRDLHDGLGQELTGVALMLRGLATKLTTQCPEAVGQITEITGLINHSIETARSMARGLLPFDSAGGGLGEALRGLAQRTHDLCGLEVDCQVAGTPERPLSESTSKHLYRIAQEALTNAARHSEASRVNLGLQVTAGGYALRIADNGVGLAAGSGNGSGLGLKIMRDRAAIIGASFEAQPNSPRGTVIIVTGQSQPISAKLTSANTV